MEKATPLATSSLAATGQEGIGGESLQTPVFPQCRRNNSPVPYTLSMAWSYSPSSQDGHKPLPNTSWVSWPCPSQETMAIHGSTAVQHSSACHPPALCQSQIPRDHQGIEWKQTSVPRKKCLGGSKSKFTFPLL